MNRQNYLARKEQNKQNRIAAGLVSEHFPEVSGMVFHMTYYRGASSQILMVRTVNVFPTSYAYFNMGCMTKGCVSGGFDLTPMIVDLIKNHKKSGSGKIVCSGENDDLAPDHSSISYKICIQYHKQSKKISL